MAEGVLLVFHLPPGSTPAEHRTFRRRVYGEATSSWGGKYRYRRKGALEAIPHVRLYWGVVIVRGQDGRKTTRLLRDEGAEVSSRQVILTTADRGQLHR
jgi:hypothetical protein